MPTVDRRRFVTILFGGALGATLTACRTKPRSSHKGGSPTYHPAPDGVDPFVPKKVLRLSLPWLAFAMAAAGAPEIMTHLQAGFAKVDPQVAIVNGFDSPHGELPLWQLQTTEPRQLPSHAYPLNAAIRAENVDAQAVLPGTFDAFSQKGVIYGLPYSIVPISLWYRPAVLSRIGVSPPPSRGWTVPQFLAACGRVEAAVAKGRLKGIRSALGPMVGRGGNLAGELEDVLLWSGFILGYGGALINKGRFDFTGSGALAGLDELVYISRRFGAKTSASTESALAAAYQAAAFTFIVPIPRTGWQQARMLRFPVRAVVPCSVLGVGLSTTTGGRVGDAQAAELAAVRFMKWLWQAEQQGVLMQMGYAPISSNVDVQGAYWGQRPWAQDFPAALVDPTSGWPRYPFVKLTTLMSSALSHAVQRRHVLVPELRRAAQALNS